MKDELIFIVKAFVYLDLKFVIVFIGINDKNDHF